MGGKNPRTAVKQPIGFGRNPEVLVHRDRRQLELGEFIRRFPDSTVSWGGEDSVGDAREGREGVWTLVIKVSK